LKSDTDRQSGKSCPGEDNVITYRLSLQVSASDSCFIEGDLKSDFDYEYLINGACLTPIGKLNSGADSDMIDDKRIDWTWQLN
jgi:hypothetical protein